MKAKLIILLSIAVVMVGVGCVALSHLATPGDVDTGALKYAIDSGVAEPNDYDAWYPNLDEATRLKYDVDAAHTLNQEALQHLIEKDTTQYSIHQKVVTRNHKTAVQREEMLFGETGLLPLGLSILGAGSAAGVLGLLRKRPGDITPKELETTLADATGKTQEELSVKEKQMIQLVKGVQAYMGSCSEGSVALTSIKDYMDKSQDKDTQAAVAVIKKTT